MQIVQLSLISSGLECNNRAFYRNSDRIERLKVYIEN